MRLGLDAWVRLFIGGWQPGKARGKVQVVVMTIPAERGRNSDLFTHTLASIDEMLQDKGQYQNDEPLRTRSDDVSC